MISYLVMKANNQSGVPKFVIVAPHACLLKPQCISASDYEQIAPGGL